MNDTWRWRAAMRELAVFFNVHRTWERQPEASPDDVAEWIKQAVTSTQKRVADLEDDARATGDVLARLLDTERCPNGNICHANDLALKLTELDKVLGGALLEERPVNPEEEP